MARKGSSSEGEPRIKLQLLLKQPHRNADGIAKVKGLLIDLGVETTAAGAATIAAATSAETFERLFGVRAVPIAPQGPTQFEAGRSGGYSAPELAVPRAIRDYVESISVAGPYILHSSGNVPPTEE